MATWKTPSSPAKHAIPLISWQQATSCAVDGNTRILANADVPDVTPRRMKYGEMPKELRRVMMRMCWGRYEQRMPRMIRLWYVSDWGLLVLVLRTRTRIAQSGRCLARPARGSRVLMGPLLCLYKCMKLR
jgi:hypothetical protein